MRNFANRSPPEICPRVGMNIGLWALFWKKMMMMMMSIIHNFISHRRCMKSASIKSDRRIIQFAWNCRETQNSSLDWSKWWLCRAIRGGCMRYNIHTRRKQPNGPWESPKMISTPSKIGGAHNLTSGDDALSDIYSSVLRLPSNLVGRQWIDRLGSNSIWIKPWHMKEERVHITRTSSSRLNLGSHLT